MAANQTTVSLTTQNEASPIAEAVDPLAPKDPAGKAADQFDENLIKKYPRSNRKISVEVQAYTLLSESSAEHRSQTSFISPHGMEFLATKEYTPGTLLKIMVSIPDYWSRKQRFVDYNRIDTPNTFKVLAKVVKSEDIGKRGKKKIVLVQTVNMDEVDEQVLKSYLQDG
jgi:hypothetical protein